MNYFHENFQDGKYLIMLPHNKNNDCKEEFNMY